MVNLEGQLQTFCREMMARHLNHNDGRDQVCCQLCYRLHCKFAESPEVICFLRGATFGSPDKALKLGNCKRVNWASDLFPSEGPEKK